MNTQSLKQSTAAGGELAAWLEGAWPKVAAAAAGIWLQFPPLFLLLLVMSGIDIAAGYSAARSRGDCDAGSVRPGAWSKLTAWLAAGGGYVLDRFIAIGPVTIAGLSIVPSFGAALCGIFILEEFTSILQNAQRSGRGRSPRFRKLFAGLKAIEGDESK
jgi:hypothetical protein